MQSLYSELGVLAKAVQFKNLSSAAQHVGVSQPQLSRIIAKIEEELQVVLLDRSAKRKSGWTPVALRLAEIFDRTSKIFEHEIQSASNDQIVGALHIGALEGLSGLAIKMARSCFESIGVHQVFLDLHDLSELEAKFLSGDLDLIFTSKIPGRQNFKHVETVGYQSLDRIQTNEKFALLSPFEFSRQTKKDLENFDHVLVSNSVAVKKEWFRNVGGVGTLPSEPRKERSKNQEVIFLIGSELMSPALWDKIIAAISVE